MSKVDDATQISLVNAVRGLIASASTHRPIIPSFGWLVECDFNSTSCICGILVDSREIVYFYLVNHVGRYVLEFIFRGEFDAIYIDFARP